MWILFLVLPSWATDFYQQVRKDGTVVFTDSPADNSYRRVVLGGRHLVPLAEVDTTHFPRLDDFDESILYTAWEHGISAALVKAVVLAESGMDPKAESPVGACGLMQLMPATAQELGVVDVWDPVQNISGGTRYLAQQIGAFGDVRLALAAYNAGPGAVREHRGIPPYEETKDYVEKVMEYYTLFARYRPIHLRPKRETE